MLARARAAISLPWRQISIRLTLVQQQQRAYQKSRVKQLILGIDEAGRGPVIGPMVIAGVLLSERASDELALLGVRDSKKIAPAKREELYNKIIEWSHLIISRHVDAKEIDDRRKAGESLNQIEVNVMFVLFWKDIVKELQNQMSIQYKASRITHACIDACDIRADRFGSHFTELLPDTHIFSEHKADDTFTSAGAASVIAKYQRDEAIRALEEKHSIKIGSGYPSDPYTIAYLQQFYHPETGELTKALPSYVRQTWISKPRKPVTNATVSAPVVTPAPEDVSEVVVSRAITVEEPKATRKRRKSVKEPAKW